MPQKSPNQLHRDLLGVNSLNPYDGMDSSGRKQMFSSHIGQTLVVKGATERRIQTGMEREFGKYTFSTKIPADCTIIKVIERYRGGYGQDTIAYVPEAIIIYEEDITHRIGMISVKNYCSHHQYFGFEYKRTNAMSRIRPTEAFKGGTILQDSPNVTANGAYKYGVECNMMFGSLPGTSEDGIVISRDVLSRFAFNTFETRTVEFGAKWFPINLYGDEKTYKPFPDIGDPIRPDGLLAAFRRHDENLAPVEQNIYALQEPDFIFDKLVYAAGAGGEVIDIRVDHDAEASHIPTPLGMELQAEKYDRARRNFYMEIKLEYDRLKRLRQEKLRTTPEFHRLVVEAISVVGDTKGKKIVRLYRQAPLDDWRLTFVVKYLVTPTIGFKLTDCHGGKGVICQIREPHEMPFDEAGNRADLVVDPGSTNSRMNIGRLQEQYVNAAGRDCASRIRTLMGFEQKGHPNAEERIMDMEQVAKPTVDIAWDYLLGFYKITSPKTFVWMTSTDGYAKPRAHHLAEIINKGMYVYSPPDNDPEHPQVVAELQERYRPVYGPITYVGNSGRTITTRNPGRIGSLYIILLEKTADDWTACPSGKLQHFGVLSQVTNSDKFSQPSRTQAIRAWGESEVRVGVSYAGPHVMAEILDRNSNPQTHKQILHSLFAAETPTNIVSVVDRSKIPLGGSKPLQLVKHIAECGGWRFVYKPHEATAPHMPAGVAHDETPLIDKVERSASTPLTVMPAPARDRPQPMRPVRDLPDNGKRIRPQSAQYVESLAVPDDLSQE
ncbi:DNA-directed RNA polymerase subunit beta [compost metagenome]